MNSCSTGFHSFSWMVYLALSEGMTCSLLMFWENVVGMFRCRAEHDYCESKQSRRHHTAETKIVYPVLGKKNHFAFGDTSATQDWWCFCSWLVVSNFSTTLVVISFTILKLSHNIQMFYYAALLNLERWSQLTEKNGFVPKWSCPQNEFQMNGSIHSKITHSDFVSWRFAICFAIRKAHQIWGVPEIVATHESYISDHFICWDFPDQKNLQTKPSSYWGTPSHGENCPEVLEGPSMHVPRGVAGTKPSSCWSGSRSCLVLKR